MKPFYDSWQVKLAAKRYKRPRSVLRRVRAALDRNPGNFARGNFERPDPRGDEGYARCALGWIRHYSYDVDAEAATRKFLQENGMTHPRDSILYVNDERGRKAVIAALDRALDS